MRVVVYIDMNVLLLSDRTHWQWMEWWCTLRVDVLMLTEWWRKKRRVGWRSTNGKCFLFYYKTLWWAQRAWRASNCHIVLSPPSYSSSTWSPRPHLFFSRCILQVPCLTWLSCVSTVQGDVLANIKDRPRRSQKKSPRHADRSELVAVLSRWWWQWWWWWWWRRRRWRRRRRRRRRRHDDMMMTTMILTLGQRSLDVVIHSDHNFRHP